MGRANPRPTMSLPLGGAKDRCQNYHSGSFTSLVLAATRNEMYELGSGMTDTLCPDKTESTRYPGSIDALNCHARFSRSHVALLSFAKPHHANVSLLLRTLRQNYLRFEEKCTSYGKTRSTAPCRRQLRRIFPKHLRKRRESISIGTHSKLRRTDFGFGSKLNIYLYCMTSHECCPQRYSRSKRAPASII